MNEALESFFDYSSYNPVCSRESGDKGGRRKKAQKHMLTPGLR